MEMAQAIGVTNNELQEMEKVDVEMRLLAKETGVPLKDIRKMSKEKRFSLMRRCCNIHHRAHRGQ